MGFLVIFSILDPGTERQTSVMRANDRMWTSALGVVGESLQPPEHPCLPFYVTSVSFVCQCALQILLFSVCWEVRTLRKCCYSPALQVTVICPNKCLNPFFFFCIVQGLRLWPFVKGYPSRHDDLVGASWTLFMANLYCVFTHFHSLRSPLLKFHLEFY